MKCSAMEKVDLLAGFLTDSIARSPQSHLLIHSWLYHGKRWFIYNNLCFASKEASKQASKLAGENGNEIVKTFFFALKKSLEKYKVACSLYPISFMSFISVIIIIIHSKSFLLTIIHSLFCTTTTTIMMMMNKIYHRIFQVREVSLIKDF